MKIILTVVCILPFLLTTPALSAVFYVNGATGNDTNTCTSTDHPCKTIKAAVDKTPAGHHTIRVTKGTYVEDGMEIVGHKFITIKGGYNDNFAPRICGQKTVIQTGFVDNNDNSLILFNIDGQNIQASLKLHCLTMQRKWTIEETAIKMAIQNYAEAWLTMDHVQFRGFNSNDVVHLISKDNSILHAQITNSRFWNNLRYGNINSMLIKTEARSDGTVYLNLDKLTFNGNCSAVTGPILIYTSDAKSYCSLDNIIIAGNYNNYRHADIDVSINRTGQCYFNMNNSTLQDNTMQDNKTKINLSFSAFDHATITAKLHNIILNRSTHDAIHFRTSGSNPHITFTTDYSILGGHDVNGNNISYTSSHEVHGDPLLDSRYHLRQGSPAIDTGICGYWDQSLSYHRIAPDDDIDGDKRPGLGTFLGCDIGADEYKPFSWPMFLPAIVHQRGNP